MQTALKLGPTQAGIDFPMPLSEKYRPRHIGDFAGLDEVKRVLAGLVRSPRPCGLLLVGAPGVGKTSVGMALAEDLPGTLCHISSQKCHLGPTARETS